MVKDNSYPAIVLFATAVALLSAGWLMGSFPIFVFFGLAPLLALTDRVNDTSAVWEKMEWVLLALTVMFLAVRQFDFSYTVSSMVYAIVFTLPFIGNVWLRQVLGEKAGKITLLLFWLTLEYALIKLKIDGVVFLADAIWLQSSWTHWNIHTGYLGASLWVLVTNLLVYQSLLSAKPFQWHWMVLTVISLAGPIVYSYFNEASSVHREDMMNLYSGKTEGLPALYLARGEFVVRTAAWISTLVLLFTLVKSQIKKR